MGGGVRTGQVLCVKVAKKHPDCYEPKVQKPASDGMMVDQFPSHGRLAVDTDAVSMVPLMWRDILEV